jgi:hypothetical protein
MELLKQPATPLVEEIRVLEPEVILTGAGKEEPSEAQPEAQPEEVQQVVQREPETEETKPGLGSEGTQPASEPPKDDTKPHASGTDNARLDVEWDLAGSLRKQEDLFSDLTDEKREAKVQKLASLLQLRSLFVIALFMLMPDSSDVYLADGERVEMPMI